jgi:hypothetical protein
VPLFTEDIKFFFQSTAYEQLKEDDRVFPYQYGVFLFWLRKKGKEVLGKKITPHCLRHSSATYYSREFNGDMVLIANRYGWSYSSDELKTYIRRSGAYQKQGVKQVFTNEVIKLKEEMEKLKQQNEQSLKRLNDVENLVVQVIRQSKTEKQIKERIAQIKKQEESNGGQTIYT